MRKPRAAVRVGAWLIESAVSRTNNKKPSRCDAAIPAGAQRGLRVLLFTDRAVFNSILRASMGELKHSAALDAASMTLSGRLCCLPETNGVARSGGEGPGDQGSPGSERALPPFLRSSTRAI